MSGLDPTKIDLRGIQMISTDEVKAITMKMEGVQQGVILDYDLSTIAKQFSITPTGAKWTDGTNTYNTTLDKLCAVEQALQSVEIPPNATTLQVDNKLLATNGLTNSITVDASVPNIVITDGVNTNTLTAIKDSNASTITITDNDTASTLYPTFTGNSGTGQTLYIDKTTNPLTYVPSTGTLTTTNFSGLASNATNSVNSTNAGITTNNANSVHYLTFVDNASNSNQNLQVNNGLSCNPNTNTITATTFVGALTGNADTATTSTDSNNILTSSDNTFGSYYIPFVKTSGTGNKPLFLDDASSPLIYNPNISTIYATTFSGNANTATTSTNSNNILTSSDNTNGTYYIPFVKTSGTGNKPLFIDDVSSPLIYNPNISNLSATTFSGALIGNANSATTSTNSNNILTSSDNTNGTYYIPFVKTSGTGNKPLFMDDVTTPLTYNPSTGTLSALTFSGALSGNADTATTATNANNVAIASNDTNATYYPVFSSGVGNQSLLVDNSTTPFSINPNTNALSFGNSIKIEGTGGTNRTAIGLNAGLTTQGTGALAIGFEAGKTNQGNYCTALGNGAQENGSGTSAIAIGKNAGQGTSSIMGDNSIAIGNVAGQASQVANSICLNASGVALNPGQASLYIDPIRGEALGLGVGVLKYNSTTKEITYSTT